MYTDKWMIKMFSKLVSNILKILETWKLGFNKFVGLKIWGGSYFRENWMAVITKLQMIVLRGINFQQKYYKYLSGLKLYSWSFGKTIIM